MPIVLPDTFVQQRPGQNARDFLGAYEGMSSIMERKQRLNMAQEQQDMLRTQAEQQKMEFIAKLPAIQANAELQVANARAAIKLSADNSIQEAKAATAWEEPDGYNERFQNILRTIHDPTEQAAALQALQGEVAWTKQFKAYAPGVDAVNNARASAFTLASTNYKIDQHLEEQRVNAEARKAAAEKNARTAIEIAQIRANAPVAIQKLTDAYAAAKESGADEEILAALRSAMEKTATRAQQASAVERAIANRDAALANGDRAKAQVFQDEINKATSFASDPIKNPLPSSSAKASPSESKFVEKKLPSGATIKFRETTAK